MHTVIADKQQRVRLPDAKPGQVFEYKADPTGTLITLEQVKKSAPRRVQAKLFRQKDGRLVFEIPKGLELAEGAIQRTVPR